MIKNYENGVNTELSLHGVDESWLNLGASNQVEVKLMKWSRWCGPERGGSDEKRKMQEPLWRLTASNN